MLKQSSENELGTKVCLEQEMHAVRGETTRELGFRRSLKFISGAYLLYYLR